MVKHTQTICRLLPKNFLSVFDHFVVLMPKGLKGGILSTLQIALTLILRCVKSVHIRSYSGPYFPASIRIRKTRTRITLNTVILYAVLPMIMFKFVDYSHSYKGVITFLK